MCREIGRQFDFRQHKEKAIRNGPSSKNGSKVLSVHERDFSLVLRKERWVVVSADLHRHMLGEEPSCAASGLGFSRASFLKSVFRIGSRQ